MKKTNEEKNKLIEGNGITLIALVVTIVILLILAGVSINMLFGKNGIVEKAKSTGKIQTLAYIKECLELEKENLQVEGLDVNLSNYLEQISTGEKSFKLSEKEIIDDKNANITINEQYKFLLRDTENGDVEIVYEGVYNASNLVLSSYGDVYTYPTSGTFSVIKNVSGGELSVENNSPDIADVSIDGNEITVIPGKIEGTAKITVKSSAMGEYAENKVEYSATIKNGIINLEMVPYVGTYDGNVHDTIAINAEPSDANIEYSTDGNNYSTIIPTIKDSSEVNVTVKASKEGYATITKTETAKVTKASGSLKLSATSGTYTYPHGGTFTVNENTGALSVKSSDTNIANVNINGRTVTVTPGTHAGTAEITVISADTTNYTEKTAKYNATVNIATFTASSGVGYYADVDGNGTVDGIIFEDFKVGGSGIWGSSKQYGKYSVPTNSNTKSYYVSKKNYNGLFGTKDVLTPLESGNDRFYVMALNDYSTKQYAFWDAEKITSGSWSVPKANEWAAFAQQFGINTDNYSKYGLKGEYWSSYRDKSNRNYYINFGEGRMGTGSITFDYYIRLSTTF